MECPRCKRPRATDSDVDAWREDDKRRQCRRLGDRCECEHCYRLCWSYSGCSWGGVPVSAEKGGE